jgi:hypothetical protein
MLDERAELHVGGSGDDLSTGQVGCCGHTQAAARSSLTGLNHRGPHSFKPSIVYNPKRGQQGGSFDRHS